MEPFGTYQQFVIFLGSKVVSVLVTNNHSKSKKNPAIENESYVCIYIERGQKMFSSLGVDKLNLFSYW